MSIWVALTASDRARACGFLRSHGVRVTDHSYLHAIGVDQRGELQSVVVYSDFNGKTCAMHVAARSGRVWCTRAFLWLVLNYPFAQAKCVEVLAWVNESNARMRGILDRLGFGLRYGVWGGADDGARLLLYSLRRGEFFGAAREVDHG